MPTTFLGLFLFSTALSLICTFFAVAVTAIVKRVRSAEVQPPRLH
jgi:hypothetical protein